MSSSHQQPPKALIPWLFSDTPITNKLHELTGEAKLVLLSQGLISPTPCDKKICHLSDVSLMVREIIMQSHGRTYWYARTLIPSVCYQQDNLFFDRLKNETLRELIYNEPKVRRVNRTIYSVTSNSLEMNWIKPHERILELDYWMRVSEFLFCELETFYLIEIFFPSILELA